MPKVLIASDHAGYQFKNELVRAHPNIDWEDLGTHNTDKTDYPDWADKLIEAVKKSDDIGILVCGSGQGMAMRANRHKEIRAALCWNQTSARLAREHNDANVLCIGARLIPLGLAQLILEVFLETPFAGGRHFDRIKKLDK